METVKKTKEFQILKKRSGRYGVIGADGKWMKGEDKVKILLKEKLIKLTPPKPKVEPAPADSAPAQ